MQHAKYGSSCAFRRGNAVICNLFNLGYQIPKRGLFTLFLLLFIVESYSVTIIRHDSLNAVPCKLLLTLVHADDIDSFFALRQCFRSVIDIPVRQIHRRESVHSKLSLKFDKERNSFPEKNFLDSFLRCVIIYFTQCDFIIHFYSRQFRFYHNNLSFTTDQRVSPQQAYAYKYLSYHKGCENVVKESGRFS